MSGSLIFIAVVWIVLLAPLLLRNQSPVRRTAKALTETRVLHEGGTSLQRKRRLKPAQSLYSAHDDDEELELVDAEPEFFLIDDEERPQGAKSLRDRTAKACQKPVDSGADKQVHEDEIETVDAEVVGDAATKSEPAESVSDATGQSASEAETIDGEVVAAEDSGVDSDAKDAEKPQSTFRDHDETDTGVFKPVRLVAEEKTVDRDNGDDADKDAHAGVGGDAKTAAAETAEAETEDNAQAESAGDETGTRHRDIPVAYFRGSDLDASAEIEEAERGVEQGEKEEAAAATKRAEAERIAAEESRAELDDEEIAYLAARKGRGVYDPEASRRAAERRLQRRKQVLAVLLGLCVVTLALGFIFGGAVWFSTVAAVGVTVLYLYFLRVNALEEARMRQRRIARMRRARLGVRNTEDGELGVPNRLRRPGAVIVESDDVDPEFEHLEYIHGSDYFDDYDGHDQHQRIRAV